jgi:hypothetical protein
MAALSFGLRVRVQPADYLRAGEGGLLIPSGDRHSAHRNRAAATSYDLSDQRAAVSEGETERLQSTYTTITSSGTIRELETN